MAPVHPKNKKSRNVKKAKNARETRKDIATLITAVKQVKIDKQSIRSVAKLYQIPFKTLSRYITKISEKIPDITAIDDNTLEKNLKKIISRGPQTVCY